MNTTHRCSLPIANNEFLIDTNAERVYSSALENTVPMAFLAIQEAAEIEYHRIHGFSPNCVICRDEAKPKTGFGYPLTYREAEAIRNKHAAFRAAGGTYSL